MARAVGQEGFGLDGNSNSLRAAEYGKGFDTGTSKVGAGFLSFGRFSRFLVVFLGFPGGFPSALGLFQSLCVCGCDTTAAVNVRTASRKICGCVSVHRKLLVGPEGLGLDGNSNSLLAAE